MNKFKQFVSKKLFFWLVVLAAFMVTAATVYAVLPAISLNFSTSFPVDI